MPARKRGPGQTNGQAYAMDRYESIVDGLLGQVTLDAAQLAAVVSLQRPDSYRPEPNRCRPHSQRTDSGSSIATFGTAMPPNSARR